MPIVLHRVDVRRIRGQVVVGGGGPVRPDRYLGVVLLRAARQWELEGDILGVPEGVEVEFVTSDEARSRLEEWRGSELRSVLLTRDLATILDLARGGTLRDQEVNLGGLHLKKGREEVLPYLFLDPTDRETLQDLAEEGVLISAQDLPGSPKISLEDLLG